MKKFSTILPLLLIVLMVLSFIGCASSREASDYDTGGTMAVPAPESAPMESADIFQSKGYDEDMDYDDYSVNTATDIERKIIKNGSMTIEVENVIEAMEQITDISKELGGYVVSSNKYSNDETRGTVAIRVPADRFDEAFELIREIAIETPHENKSSQDVTEEYTDLEAQLRNLEATETQYLELLKKAESVEDMVTVQRELSEVRGEIERIEGRMNYIDRTSDMSYIDISVREQESLSKKKWNPSQTLVSAANGFLTFLKALVNIIIWVAIFCPIWIPILVVVIRRRRKKREKAKEKMAEQ